MVVAMPGRPLPARGLDAGRYLPGHQQLAKQAAIEWPDDRRPHPDGDDHQARGRANLESA